MDNYLDIEGNNLPKETEGISSLNELKTLVATNSEIDSNLSLMVKVKNEYELPQTASINNSVTSILVEKIEPRWDECDDIEQILEDSFLCEQKLMTDEECIFDVPDKITLADLKVLKVNSPLPIELPIKAENIEAANETEKEAEIVLDDSKMTHDNNGLEEEQSHNINILSDATIQGKAINNYKHKCKVCDYRTNKKNHFDNHLLRHKSMEKVFAFSCNQCDFKSKYKGNLKSHIKRHDSPKENDVLKCDLCAYQTRIKGALKQHYLSHMSLQEVGLFGCGQCEFRTKYKCNLNSHIKRHESRGEMLPESPSENEVLKCEMCPYQTRFKGGLKQHYLRHKSLQEVELFGCSQCDFRSKYKGNVKCHIQKHENPEEVTIYKCDQFQYQGNVS